MDVVLNCQLPAMLRPCGGGPEGELEGGLEGGPEGGPEVLTPPPHPQSTTSAESNHEVLAKCFMELSPLGRFWHCWTDGRGGRIIA
jgi:hypothetical protein